ncbi:Hypa-like protein [Pleurostoma richardsiae]|uniref:Hypa-like protein n=1 Tax=Pleurostoma richardsiae TaxID=41990 RepID=A0AA38R8Y4_9PEZI|nr:Hypa-like protein [Pleurostoma richardsiae]
MTASTIRLPSEPYGIFKTTDIVTDSIEKCNTLLDVNHEKYHTFFRDPAFHNHMAHSLLTNLALGATPEEIVDRFNDLVPIMRQIPDVDQALLEKLDDPEVFYDAIGQIHQYHTFLDFFTCQIDAKGWKAVVQEYVFARTKLANRMLAQVFEGAYHPLIHLGFGIEFDQPAIVAEGLSQAASHASMNIEKLFFDSEALAAELPQPSAKPKPLLELVHEVRASEAIRNGPRWSDLADKMKNGTIGRSGGELTKIAAQFIVRGAGDDVEELERRTAEMISVCAYLTGSVLRADKKRKIEFFIMHAVTSSIFLTVLTRQDWIAPRDKARLVEWKGRLDLAWYATEGVPPLDETAISGYRGSEELGWPEIFIAARRESDDGHVSKFIRALKNGEIVAKKYEEGEWADYFPMKQDMWIKLARICLDTTTKLPWDIKWVWFAGFNEAWQRPDLAI